MIVSALARTKIATQDSSSSPNCSPATVAIASSYSTLIPPNGAVALVLTPSNSCRVSENILFNGSTGGGFDLVLAAATKSIPVVGGTPVYLAAATGSITANFHFEILVD